jgi:hypothetical protein
MQSSNENNKKNSAAQSNSELSEAWQALLGAQSTATPDVQQVQHLATPDVQHLATSEVQQVQQLVSDPWSNLLNSRGMQPVDLQKVRLPHRQGDDHDVEHALDIMREAPDAG